VQVFGSFSGNYKHHTILIMVTCYTAAYSLPANWPLHVSLTPRVFDL